MVKYDMISLLESIRQIDPWIVVTSLVLVLMLIPTAIDSWNKFLKAIGLVNSRDLHEESQEQRLEELNNKIEQVQADIFDKQEVYHQQSICIREELKIGQDSLKEDVEELKHILQEYIKKDNEKTVATLRTSLWRMHKCFVDQGYVTPDGLKTFIEEGKVYERAGGNDIYHDKLLPEVLNLEIRYPDGSIYRNED